MRRACLTWILGAVMVFLPSGGFGEGTAVQKAYDDCIAGYANRAPSPQAAIILQRACFYKYRYRMGEAAGAGGSAEYRKLAKIYTPPVCDCILEKMPGTPPSVPAPTVLDACIKASKTPARPMAP